MKHSSSCDVNHSYGEPFLNRLFHSGAIAIFIFILYFFAQEIGLVSDVTLVGGASMITVFILGLIASTSTCMATSGALFLATVGKLNRREASWSQNIIPGISFNAGRVLSYGLFGFITGVLGKALIANFQISSLLTLVISAVMVIIGLDMARIVSLQRFILPTFTTRIFERLEHRLMKNPHKTAFLLGGITYLLPCGFTQTVQLYALGLADPVKSATVMMVFALGTAPALLAVGMISAQTKSSLYTTFSRVMGVVVLVIGLVYFSNFLSLYGITINVFGSTDRGLGNSSVVVRDGVQIASMRVNASGYRPNTFLIKKNIPVRWEINGDNVFGCQGYLVVPKLGIQKLLESGKNIIEFTPKESGLIGFSCGMGMYRGSFSVVDG